MSPASIARRLFNLIRAYLRRSLRRQLMFGFGGATLLLILTSSYVLYNQQRQALYLDTVDTTTSLAVALANSSSQWLLGNDVEGL
ncbi:MAG: hypothetical protein HY016_11125, partial [Nitrosomonadales bacterium]|nr:hypothetical protein [Nitrosomonadales bacterium]